jgi:hypothetical protein
MSEIAGSIKHLHDVGKHEDAYKLAKKNGQRLKMRQAYNAVKRQLSAVNRRMRHIKSDGSLAPHQKTAKLREYSALKNRLTRSIVMENR